jgi:uncharacterized protein (DUF924 family)
MEGPDEILHFWFGAPATDADSLSRNLRRWFRADPAVDDQIRQRFGPLIEPALRGDLDDWATKPHSRRALILLLDQFTRNLGRGTAAAYVGDVKAQALAVEALDRGEDAGLAFEEVMFLAMPLGHAEDLGLQERNVTLLERHLASAPAHLREHYARAVDHPRMFRDWIRQFGRFPHRNAILGRASTPEEQAFLAKPATTC